LPFVVDASVAAGWFLDEPDHPHVTIAWRLLRTGPATVPSIWWYEIRNVLLIAERRKRLTSEDVDRALQRLRSLRIEIDSVMDDRVSLSLVRSHGLTIYDAAYLELALRLGCPLATRDRAMTKAAKAEHIALIDDPA
jgi:predicted nucleic acid-binding protein